MPKKEKSLWKWSKASWRVWHKLNSCTQMAGSIQDLNANDRTFKIYSCKKKLILLAWTFCFLHVCWLNQFYCTVLMKTVSWKKTQQYNYLDDSSLGGVACVMALAAFFNCRKPLCAYIYVWCCTWFPKTFKPGFLIIHVICNWYPPAAVCHASKYRRIRRVRKCLMSPLMHETSCWPAKARYTHTAWAVYVQICKYDCIQVISLSLLAEKCARVAVKIGETPNL